MKKQQSNSKGKSVPANEKTVVDNKKKTTTSDKKNAKPKQSGASWRLEIKHSYKTISSTLVKDKFDEFIKKENLTDKVKERKFKLNNLKSISKSVQHLLFGKNVKNISTKYVFRFNDKSTKIINISKNK